jgi:hypothetical protein
MVSIVDVDSFIVQDKEEDKEAMITIESLSHKPSWSSGGR